MPLKYFTARSYNYLNY